MIKSNDESIYETNRAKVPPEEETLKRILPGVVTNHFLPLMMYTYICKAK